MKKLFLAILSGLILGFSWPSIGISILLFESLSYSFFRDIVSSVSGRNDFIGSFCGFMFLRSMFLSEKTKDWPFETHPNFKSIILTRYLILIFIVIILYENKILKIDKTLIRK